MKIKKRINFSSANANTSRCAVFSLKKLHVGLLILLLFSLQACIQPSSPQGIYTTNEDAAQKHWQEFVKLSKEAEKQATPYNALINFRYKTPDEGHRVSAYTWGNGNPKSPYPIRMDLQSAAGTIAAKILEDETNFLIYDTESKEAYTDKALSNALLRMGIPVPFSLSELTNLFNAHYQRFFFTAGQSSMPAFVYGSTDASMLSINKGKRAGTITIDRDGRPVFWKELREKGWEMEISYKYDSPLPGPHTIKIKHPRGYSATLVLRSYSALKKKFTAEQLALPLPEGTKITPMQPSANP